MTAEPGIVDCHVHLLPGRLGEAVRAFFEAHLEGELAYPNDHGFVLDSLSAAGVVQAWHLPYAHKPAVAAGLNRASAELVARWSGHAVSLVGGAAVHPGDRSPADIVGAALDEHGLRVVKLHCSVGQFEVDDPRLDGMWEMVERRAVPVVVHAGHDASGETAGHELDPLHRVAARFPGAPIVIAHAGHPDTSAAVELVDRHENVYVDLTPRVVDRVASRRRCWNDCTRGCSSAVTRPTPRCWSRTTCRGSTSCQRGLARRLGRPTPNVSLRPNADRARRRGTCGGSPPGLERITAGHRAWIVRTDSMSSASSARLSGRWRSTRAKRSAMPPG